MVTPRVPTWTKYALAVLAAAILSAIHVHVNRQGPSYVGPLLILDHLFDFLAVLLLLAVCIGVGRFALARLGLLFESSLESLTFGVAIGAGIVATVILVLGFVSGLQAPTLLGILALLALIARKEMGSLPGLISRVLAEIGQVAGDRTTLFFGLTTFGLAVAFLTVMAVAPPVDWDAQMYHLQIPTQFLERGRIYMPDDNLHIAYVGLIHMLYLPMLAVKSASGPALLSMCMAVMLGLASFSLAARFLGGRTASLTLAMLWGTTTILLVAITPRIDVTLTFFLLLAHYALLVALESPSNRTYFYLAAVLLGLALGAKYHAALYIIGLAPLILWVSALQHPGVSSTLRSASTFGALLVAAWSVWILKNWILLGAPFYPFLASAALEPWLVPLFGSATVPSSVSPEIFNTLADARQHFNIIDAFFAPDRITIEFEGAFHYANPALLALPLWLVFLKNRTINWLIIPAVGYLLLLIVPFGAINLRYLIPAAVPLTIAVTYMLVRSSERFLSPGGSRTLLILLTLLALYSSGRATYTWLRSSKALQHLVGKASTTEYIATHLDPSVRTLASVLQFVDERVPKDGRILMLYESRGYYFDRPVILDTRVSNWPLLAHKLTPHNCLKALGISHVLLSTGAVRYYIRRGVDPELIRWNEFLSFADRCLGDPIYQGQAFVLFETS